MTIDTGELKAMRDAISELLPDVCNILTGAAVVDLMGEVVMTWTVTNSVNCRIDPIREGENISGAAVQPSYRYRVTLPYDTTIANGSRLTINGVTYDVVALLKANSWALDTRLEAVPV